MQPNAPREERTLSMLRVVTMIVCFIFGTTAAIADLTKKDLRSAPLPGEQFIAFCADRIGSVAVVGLVQGDQASGFNLDTWISHGQSTKASRIAQQGLLEGCAHAAIYESTSMLVLELDANVYTLAKEEVILLVDSCQPAMVRLRLVLGGLRCNTHTDIDLELCSEQQPCAPYRPEPQPFTTT